ncbi:unnamed protein product [Spirodela intermedia]|uniref:Knottins-like domain-containing protein n=1 Tax=Spirodela intermedia TaxID=51605 RepID=A0A7I8KR59_SPIIN|nr:unnamed protein product [Spirodela intermedia]
MARVQVFPIVFLLVMVISLLSTTTAQRLCSRRIGFCIIDRTCIQRCRSLGYLKGDCRGIFPRRCICYKRCPV